ncbi:hypothetical protein [Methyloceanibacter sp. wino2]|uniref:hypothetical protein n=1 Tax=Methyloceanibacter sp. wino2 TaxID=2170729 RepID=UPI00131ED600|nr:hypothetical protein [Methyloceanibacter sp. wino2]
MPEFSLPLPTSPSRNPVTHPVHRATALLQEALHESRRATFTQEFGEVRGIHRLSAPPAAEVFVDADTTADFVSPPANLDFVEAYLGRQAGEPRQDVPESPHAGEREDGKTAATQQRRNMQARSTQAADPQLRGLIRDFKERQRRAGLIVAGSVVSAVTLTVLTIALVFALAA